MLPEATIDVSLDGPSTTCGFRFADATCGSCLGDSCCDELSACRASQTCAPLYDCIAACPVANAAVTLGTTTPADDCHTACFEKERSRVDYRTNPKGVDNAEYALARCRASKCSACGNGLGLVEGYPSVCAACIRSRCRTDLTGCGDDADCTDRVYCRSRCLNPVCMTGCSVPPEPAVMTLLVQKANDECGSVCFGSTWACAGRYQTPRSATFTTTVAIRPVDVLDDTVAIAGATLKVCNKLDLDCANPLDMQKADDTAMATVTVPLGEFLDGFTGFLQIEAPGMSPTMLVWNYPIYAPLRRTAYTIPTPTVVSIMQNLLGVKGDPTRGNVVLDISDCTENKAPGVVVSLSREATISYFDAGFPSPTATATTRDGLVLIVNIPEGSVTVTLTHQASGQQVARFNAYVRAGWITMYEVWPSTG
ncbi:MAG: hypothetical protein WCI05_00900 [Myxococcales bacterium]